MGSALSMTDIGSSFRTQSPQCRKTVDGSYINEQGRPVGGGFVGYPCPLPVGHAGPCIAREIESTRMARTQWERQQQQASKSFPEARVYGPDIRGFQKEANPGVTSMESLNGGEGPTVFKAQVSATEAEATAPVAPTPIDLSEIHPSQSVLVWLLGDEKVGKTSVAQYLKTYFGFQVFDMPLEYLESFENVWSKVDNPKPAVVTSYPSGDPDICLRMQRSLGAKMVYIHRPGFSNEADMDERYPGMHFDLVLNNDGNQPILLSKVAKMGQFFGWV